jgi:glycerol-3-phosphate O-acyltransferase
MSTPANLPRSTLPFWWWLRRIMFFWVKTQVWPEDPKTQLELKPGVPVCYILSSSSRSDLLVLDQTAIDRGLPRPVHKKAALRYPGSVAAIYLQRLGLLQVQRESKRLPPTPVQKLVAMAEADKAMEVQIVPVSVFWGRNPGKDEKSLFKLLFFDDERAGKLQKLFIVMAQGRGTYLNFGKPISLRALVDEGAPVDETARKLTRVLRVHFRRQRTTAMGPVLNSRTVVVPQLLKSRVVREAIVEESRKKRISMEKAEARAYRYGVEIASEMQYSMVRFFDVFLGWVWNKIFDGIIFKHAHRLREIDQTHEVVYLPSHRSHMDYLLLSYSLFYQGFVPPHTAAGVNLDFWPAGPLLRRAGAFFLRRSFGGNRLYTAVFNEYMHYLLTKGHSMNFFMEGGRSRTGRLLSPKTGMLAMVVQSFFRNSDRPIVFVPIYLGYDKVMEVRTYQSELRGKKKKAESAGQLLKVRRVLKTQFGRAYIGVGEPISLEAALNAANPDWRLDTKDPEQKPKWLHPFIVNLARQALTRVNSTAIVSPVGVVALVILSSPTKAMAEDELLYMIDRFLAAMRAAPYSRDVSLPESTAKEILAYAMSVCKMERFQHPSGDVIHMDEREAVLLTYYRNNILHLIAVPSLVASYFQHNEAMSEAELIDGAALLYPFLKSEFFLRWDVNDSRKVIAGVVEALVDQGLLTREASGVLRRPAFTSHDFTCLKILGRALGHTLERYAISTALLAQHGDARAFKRKDFETQAQLLAQRISILNGINEPEFFDQSLFKNYIDLLKDLNYADEAEGGELTVDPRLRQIAESALNLLSGDIRQSIQRLPLADGNGARREPQAALPPAKVPEDDDGTASPPTSAMH